MAGAVTVTTSPEGYTSAGVTATLLEYLHACPVCRGADLRHYCRVPSLFNPGEVIRYERCAGCGVVLRNPRLPADYRVQRYADGALSADSKRLDPKNQVHYAYMIRVLRRLCPSGSGVRLLDFGCGAGGFLLEARAGGYDVTGLELSKGLARHVAETHGIRVFSGLASDPAFAAERFQVIVSSQVFEHLTDPVETLRSVRAHLVRPGILLIEVPNLRDIRERLRRGAIMDDSHLFYFSAASLRRLLEAEGFEVVETHEGLRPYRALGRVTPRVPLGLLRAGERAMALAGVRTGLSVIARLP